MYFVFAGRFRYCLFNDNFVLLNNMEVTSEKKRELFGKYSFSGKDSDTGSPESQLALFTARIKHLTEHLRSNKKDFATRLSLVKMVGKRSRLLKYLMKKDIERYRKIKESLSIRR